MISISTGMFTDLDPLHAISLLNDHNVHDIELSAGRQTLLTHADLSRYSSTNNLITHNYFPSPPEAFVFNLGSRSKYIRERSLLMAYRNIEFASSQKTKVYS